MLARKMLYIYATTKYSIIIWRRTQMRKHFLSVLLIFALIFTACVPMTAFAADQGNCVNVKLTVDGTEHVVKTYYASYTYNAYVSLEDLAYALKGTDKNFNVERNESNQCVITTGVDYTGATPVPFTKESIEDSNVSHGISFDAYTMYIDGNERELRVYDNYRYSDFKGDVKGVYMRLIDLGLFLDLAVNHDAYGVMSIDTENDFVLDLEQLDENGYFKDLDGVYLGDVTTGEKLYGWDEEHPTEIASTSKLMTMAIVLDKIAEGKINYDTIYTISDAVEYEANSEDGTLYADRVNGSKVDMVAGQTWSVDDLLHAMMLPSANEAATALAEVVAGSEAEFVKLMNAKAAELGMDTAKFVNPHGLPHYTNSQFTGKMQNTMSAEDMFKLCSYLLTEHYDATVAITADEKHELTSLIDDGYGIGGEKGFEAIPYVKTTFGTLHTNFKNTDGVLIGMKTGSTNRSGSCIVVAEVVKVDGEDHVIVGVSFGGEDNRQRYESSTVLLMYAQQWAAEGGNAPEEGEGTDPGLTPPADDNTGNAGNEGTTDNSGNGDNAGTVDKDTNKEDAAGAESEKAPATGDNTVSMLYLVGALALAAAGMGAVVYKRREN